MFTYLQFLDSYIDQEYIWNRITHFTDNSDIFLKFFLW